MAYNRVTELNLLKENLIVLEIKNNLKIDFEVEKTKDFTNNYCKCEVYNIGSDITMKVKNLSSSGLKLQLFLGYEDEGGDLVFIGNITSIKTVKGRTESKLIIEAMENLANVKESFSSISFSEKTNSNVIINKFLTDLGIMKGNEISGQEIFDNGFSYFGNSYEGLKQFLRRELDYDCFIEENKIFFIPLGQKTPTIKTTFTNLTPTSGLIEKEVFTEEQEGKKIDKIRIKSIIYPKTYVGMKGKVKDFEEYNFTVEKVKFSGSNYDGDFLMEIEGVLNG